MLRGGDVSDWLPLLSGTLQPHEGGLPSIQHRGWRLMGVAPDLPIRVIAVISTHRWEAEGKLRTCIGSLLSQSVVLDALVLAFPKWLRGSIPAWVHAWRQHHSRIQLQPLADIRPHLRPPSAEWGLSKGRSWKVSTARLLAAVIPKITQMTTWLLIAESDCSFHPLVLETLLRFAAGTPGTAVSVRGKMLLQEKHRVSGFNAWRDVTGHAGPILEIASGLLVQREMLRGFRSPPDDSFCHRASDIWISAHLARQRIRRAFLADTSLAAALTSGATTSFRNLCGDPHTRACLHALQVFPIAFKDLWRPLPRVIVCAPCLTSRLLHEAANAASMGVELHSIYACFAQDGCSGVVTDEGNAPMRQTFMLSDRLFAQLFVRRVKCSNTEPPEHAVMRGALLREREASTIMLLPSPTAEGITDQASLTTLISCAASKFGSGFCEQSGWTGVTVGALACFNSDDVGIRQIYGCAGSSEHSSNQRQQKPDTLVCSARELASNGHRWGVGQRRLAISKRRRLERKWRVKCPHVQKLGLQWEVPQSCVLGFQYGCVRGDSRSMWIHGECTGLFRVSDRLTFCSDPLRVAEESGLQRKGQVSLGRLSRQVLHSNQMKYHVCRDGSFPAPQSSCGLMIVTTFLTTRVDWQRGRVAQPRFGKIWKLYKSIISLGLNCTVIFDELPDSLISRYGCERFNFFRMNLSNFDSMLGLNDVRFFLFYAVIRAHPEWQTVFLVDAFDVAVQLNPCPFFRENILYVGSETQALKDNPWIVFRFHDLGGRYNAWFRTHASASLHTLNCGILGGAHGVMVRLLQRMTAVIADPALAVRKRRHQEINVDMAALNYVVHTEFAGRFLDGEPVHSVYKQFEIHRTDVWFVHK